MSLILTTEMLRVLRLANSVTSQVTLLPPHRASVDEMPSVPVASFTFCRPFAQAEEHTSQRKTRLAVTRKSWRTSLGWAEATNAAESTLQHRQYSQK